jgi:hypothetical protein
MVSAKQCALGETIFADRLQHLPERRPTRRTARPQWVGTQARTARGRRRERLDRRRRGNRTRVHGHRPGAICLDGRTGAEGLALREPVALPRHPDAAGRRRQAIAGRRAGSPGSPRPGRAGGHPRGRLVQAIDRPRPIWNHRHYVLLNELCLDVTYAAIYPHRQLVQGGTPIEQAFRATGIVPRTPELLHKAHRDLFRTPKAAEHALKNYLINELRVCAARSRRRNSVGRTRVGWSAMGISTRMHGNRIDHRGLSVPA